MIAVATYATKNFCRIIPRFIRRVSVAISHHKEGVFIFATDNSEESNRAEETIKNILPKEWEFKVIRINCDDTTKKYEDSSNLVIARLQGAAFEYARFKKCEALWSVESDILVPPSALKMCEWAVSIPDNYYDIAMVTYNNGLFLGGWGSPHQQIMDDFTVEERKIPEELKSRYEKIKREEKEFQEKKEQPPKEWIDESRNVSSEIRKCPPDGNIFEVNAKHGWKPRGWLDNHYPAIGKGAILPTKWVGLGCTYLNNRALELATFEGYSGGGTQDLFLCWNRWHPEGLRMAVITHVLCDHVKPDEKGNMIHHRALHEQQGNAEGHIRVIRQPWVDV